MGGITMNKLFKFTTIIFIFILSLVPFICNAQDYKRNGNVFESTKVVKTKEEPIKTDYIYKDSDNLTYTIYMSSNGSCFIIKSSKKSGKEYRKYLGADISKEICKERGIEYKGREKTVKNS